MGQTAWTQIELIRKISISAVINNESPVPDEDEWRHFSEDCHQPFLQMIWSLSERYVKSCAELWEVLSQHGSSKCGLSFSLL